MVSGKYIARARVASAKGRTTGRQHLRLQKEFDASFDQR
jgi:hypothetical protein